MKTFFSILFTFTVLIGATLLYVVKDTSSVVFEPENLTGPVSSDSVDSATDTLNSSNVAEHIDEFKNEFTVKKGEEKHPINYNEANSKTDLPTKANEESNTIENERIQNEIRELRNETNKILKEILDN